MNGYRGFTAAYLESVALARLMQAIAQTASVKEREQVRKELDTGSLVYQAAFTDMREVYAGISDETGYFGFAPDYVPFPALGPGDPNAFEVLLASAKQSLTVASQKEDLAITSNRSFETDSAMFQSELARIRTNYENQLAEICGTFRGNDRAIYPAIPTYAHLGERTRMLGDPCGLIGNGQLHEAIGRLQIDGLSMSGLKQRFDDANARIRIELERASTLCQITYDLADLQVETEESIDSIESGIERTRQDLQETKRDFDMISTVLQSFTSCIAGVATDCPGKFASGGLFAIAGEVFNSQASSIERDVLTQQDRIAALQRSTIKFKANAECDQVRANSVSVIAQINLEFAGLSLEALKQQYALSLAAGAVQKLRNQASRVMAEQGETQQLAINVEAAKNDPNVRIYRNDAVINADRAFYAAMRGAYQATKVYEYYTSQSYDRLGQLSLVRMVSRGDYNLENYLRELEDAFASFEESYGNPDTRVELLSVRDDVMQIPRVGKDGAALDESERVALFRAALADTRLLDADGYLTVPISTDFQRLSPLTRNHKLLFLEAEIIGSSVGDTLGRVYVKQGGTGAISSLTAAKSYFRFPPRTAVINPLFNGVRVFGPEVYRNERLRDLPYVNTRWDFVLNQRDEAANDDIELDSLSDIRLFVYYRDFTAL